MEPLQQNEQEATNPLRYPMKNQSKAEQSSLDQHGRRSRSPKHHHSSFRLNERVVVQNKHGTSIYGSVKWIEKVTHAGDKLVAIGIETVRCFAIITVLCI